MPAPTPIERLPNFYTKQLRYLPTHQTEL